MEIIDGTLIYKKQCPHCNNVFSYSRQDICNYETPPEQMYDGYRIDFFTYTYCPFCGEQITLAEKTVDYSTVKDSRKRPIIIVERFVKNLNSQQ